MNPPSVDLAIELAGVGLPSPVLTASGCGGTGRELDPYVALDRLGAFTTRTLTLDGRPGAASPRLLPTPGGVLSDTGGQNPGIQGFLATELPWLAQRGARTVVSVAAAGLADAAELARHAGGAPGVTAVEVDLSGRYGGGPVLDLEPYGAAKVVHVVRREVPRGVPVLVKLTPGAQLVDVASAVMKDGADGLVVGHGLPALAFDPVTLRPALGGASPSLSGPALLPVAVRAVAEVHAALPDVPVVGVGGVRSGADALQLLLAGATAVAVGTALLADPAAAARVADELVALLHGLRLSRPSDAVGLGHTILEGDPA
jgi:dihydroorotate dehydrogenase (NAD+) catalytic subunit